MRALFVKPVKRKMADPHLKQIIRTASAVIAALALGGLFGQTVGAQPSVVQDQLSDLGQFPLSLPAAQGTLVAADDRLSPVRFSQPSLTWMRDQVSARYGSDRLVEHWRAYQVDNGPNYVDIVVNEQIWSLLNYFERYAFVSQFGTAAEDYGYSVRVFHTGDAAAVNDVRANRRASEGTSRSASESTTSRTFSSRAGVVLRGGHFCDFSQAAGQISPSVVAKLPCTIVLDDASSSRIRRPNLSPSPF
ncbi:hypothetical protein BH23CYA1_BH23CYA1_02310 [soil metagenome]